MDVSANTKSEFKQLIEYIHTKSVKHIKDSKSKNVQHLKKNTTNTQNNTNQIKIFFNILNLNDNDKFKKYLRKSIISDITNELSIKKNFFTCSDVINCHRKIFYESYKYDYELTDEYIDNYIKYIKKLNFKNIIIELSNFKNNNIFINYKNKIKDFIPVIQDNILIDFFYNNIEFDENVYKLKALIHNLDLNISEKIKQIKVIKIGNSFTDVDIINLNFNKDDISLFKKIEKLNIVIKSRNIPDKEISENCINCLYSKICKPILSNNKNDEPNLNNIIQDKAKKSIKKLKPITDTKHKFLL